MKDSFISYYRPNKKQVIDLWTNCIFIFDANVLLNMYRYSNLTFQDFNKIFSKISDRIWIPHQVALEYQENRLNIIAEQVRRFSDVKKVLTETIKNLKVELDKLQLRKRHSSIDPDALIKKIEPIFKEYENELGKLEEQQPDVFDNDEIRDKFDSLFSGKIGPCPSSQEMLDEIYKDGKTRYEHFRPPGFLDNDKGENVYHFNGLVFKRKFGDLILWYQIINEAKEKKYKHIIFITDDDKEDWWWTVESKGKKIIGPRQELVNEIISETDVRSFYMYNSERFLKYAQEFFKVSIKSESIRQVRNIAINRANKASLADLLKNAEATEVLSKATLADIINKTKNFQNIYAKSALKNLALPAFLSEDFINKAKNFQSIYSNPTLMNLAMPGSLTDEDMNNLKSLHDYFIACKLRNNDSPEESTENENDSDNNEIDSQ